MVKTQLPFFGYRQRTRRTAVTDPNNEHTLPTRLNTGFRSEGLTAPRTCRAHGTPNRWFLSIISTHHFCAMFTYMRLRAGCTHPRCTRRDTIRVWFYRSAMKKRCRVYEKRANYPLRREGCSRLRPDQARDVLFQSPGDRQEKRGVPVWRRGSAIRAGERAAGPRPSDDYFKASGFRLCRSLVTNSPSLRTSSPSK